MRIGLNSLKFELSSLKDARFKIGDCEKKYLPVLIGFYPILIAITLSGFLDIFGRQKEIFKLILQLEP
jgi:hypothetical protein